MECNKEEAVRAKEEAEKKMQNKEFAVARRLALRAQQLHPNLENLSQLLLVCNVHCSAEQKLFGNEIDWYGILQIEQTADEATIKKQYRKLALQLHPDKNKFAGAEAAFKLIGEAQNLLLDRSKRYYHDMKRRAAPASCAPQKPTWNANAKKAPSNFSGVNRQHYHQSQQPAQPNSRPTFWTKCSFCFIRYQYYHELLGRTLTCQVCKKAFVAVNICQPAVPTSTHRSQPAHCQQKEVPNPVGYTAGVNFGGNASSKKSEAESLEKTVNGSQASSKKGTNKRRRMQVSESSEDDDSDSSSDSEYDVVIDDSDNLQATKDFGSRRSTRQKQKVSYSDPLTDDDDEAASSPKQAEVGEPTEEEGGEALMQEELEKKRQPGTDDEVNGHGGKEREGVPKESVEHDPAALPTDSQKFGSIHTDVGESGSACEAKVKSSSEDLEEDVKVPDPEFHNFDDDRSVEKFNVGEIWSIYSDEDGLPKYYGRIKNICTRPGVSLDIVWLELSNVPNGTIHWSDEKIPVSCGNFRIMKGSLMSYDSTDCFSHRVAACERRRNLFMIFPRKGEIWALYRDWKPDMKCSELENCEYDVVQVHEVNDATINVIILEHVQGFSTVFKPCNDGGSPVVRPVYKAELLRFSHQIPAFQLSDERNGSLRGYWELDPQAFPVSFFSSK